MKSKVQQSSGLRRIMLINTASNYLFLAAKTVLTIFLTRIIFLGITRQDYGFWALLWSIFGYSLLLDFGFGTSIQKYTSEVKVNNDWQRYNRLVSTVFFSYCFMAVIIIAVTIILGGFLEHIFQLETETKADILRYKTIFCVFGIGTAFVFPFGFFTEMLRGLQLIHLRNMISFVFLLMNFIFLALAIKMGYSLFGMAVVTILTNLLTNLTMGWLCLKKLPQLRIRIRNFSFTHIREVMGFSFFAYIIMFSNLIIFRTDQMVISICGAVSLVAVYQIASRLAELFRQFASQFHDNLGPVAASLFTLGEHDKLSLILLQSNRLVGMIATGMFIPLFVYVRPLLKVWLELSDRDGTICVMILLASMYFLVFIRSSMVQVLIMCNQHKRLTWIAIGECLANLIISVALIRHIGIVGVALGTLIPNVLFGVCFNVPYACRFAKIDFAYYFRESVLRTLIVGLGTAVIALSLYAFGTPQTFLMLFVYASAVCVFYALTIYMIGLHSWERREIEAFIMSKLRVVALVNGEENHKGKMSEKSTLTSSDSSKRVEKS